MEEILAFGLFVWIIIGIIAVVLPILAIINIIRSRFKDDSLQVIWILVVILLPILGSIIYFILSPSHKK